MPHGTWCFGSKYFMPLVDRRVLWEWTSAYSITIYYSPYQGPLENSEQVYIHLGKDGWKHVLGTFLMNKWDTFFEYQVSDVLYCTQLDFVFTDGNQIWDNNQNRDWHIVWREQRDLKYLDCCPVHPSTTFGNENHKQVIIFWDIENCAVPSSVSGSYVVRKIRNRMQLFGDIQSIRVYACMELLNTELKLALQSSGVELIDARRDKSVRSGYHNADHCVGKDAADKLIISDMWSTAWKNKAKDVCIALVSGDRDFAYALSKLSMLGYCTVLIYPRFASSNLVDSASFAIPWKDSFWACGDEEECQGILPSHLPYRQRAVLRSAVSHYCAYACHYNNSNTSSHDISFVTHEEEDEEETTCNHSSA